jgi:hypothetical protein
MLNQHLFFQDLLGHPVAMALIRYKWNQFGCYVYFIALFLYLLFVAALTAYIILTPASYSHAQVMNRIRESQPQTARQSNVCVRHTLVSWKKFHCLIVSNFINSVLESNLTDLLEDRSTSREGYGSDTICLELQSLTGLTITTGGRLAQIFVFCLAGLHIVKELFQLFHVSAQSALQ